MMAAEKWHEYQSSYHKYGLEMRPSPAKTKKEEDKPVRSFINAKDRARLMLLTVFVGLLCFCLIISAAYSAQVKYNINGLLAQSDLIRGEIENLNVSLKSASSITIIEEKATSQLGMVYPALDQVAYINHNRSEVQNFTLTLKEIAYKD